MPFASQQLFCKPRSRGQRPVIILSLSDGSSDNFLAASMLRWGGVKKSAGVRNGKECVELEPWYIDGIDICSRQWFEFVNPHYSLSLSEDSIINIVRGAHAPMNTKVLFAFSRGFAPKSIRKICTLHQYEFENLALLKLSQCFSPTQHNNEIVSSRLTYSY